MTILDYLLLGGFLAAGIYAVYRLFIGWRNPSSTFVESAVDGRRTTFPTLKSEPPRPAHRGIREKS